jgi:hypothetical protein
MPKPDGKEYQVPAVGDSSFDLQGKEKGITERSVSIPSCFTLLPHPTGVKFKVSNWTGCKTNWASQPFWK